MTTMIGPRQLVLPRFGTPRNENRETYGPQVGLVAQRLGLEPMPHQQHIWDVALEIDGSGRFVYDEVDLSTMRQTSKTTTMFMKQVWRLTMGARMWGPQRSTYTAQKRQMARNKLERDFAEGLLRCVTAQRSFTEIKNPKARPRKPSEWKLSLNNGSEHLLFGRGNYLQIDAPTTTAGHGDTLDDGNIDEAFAHGDDSVEQAMRPAQATRFNAQLWVGSTAGDERSRYWHPKVKAGRAQIESGAPSNVAYFEWSLPDEVDIDDEDAWWEFMPALGHTISPDFVRGELERARRNPDEGGEDLWRRAYGNQWVRVPMSREGKAVKLPADKWRDTGVAKRVPVNPGEVTLAFDVDRDGLRSSIGIGAGSMHAPYVEEIENNPGVGWLPARLVELVRTWDPIAVGCNGAGPAGGQVGPVLAAFSEAGIDANLLHQLNALEYKQACGGFYSDVIEGRLKRPAKGQGPLDVAVADATERPLGDAWAWDRRNLTVPIASLVAVTIARALLPTTVTDEVDPFML